MNERTALATLVVGAAGVAACGSSATPSAFQQDAATTSGDDAGGAQDSGVSGDDSALFGPDASTVEAGTSDCPDAAKLVYVTGVGDELWSFYPPKLQFTLVGKFDCLTGPTHMTVDRQAVAWVVASGNVYKASTKDAKCTLAATWTPQPNYSDFALTFIGTSGVDNTLYLMGGQSLGRFDVVSGKVTTIGNAPGQFVVGDMTSNEDGTLWFLWDENPPTLYDIDPKNANVLSQNALSATGGGDQALAFWGGSFYAFENNTIYQYDPQAKTTKAIGTAPLSVTGAGQSTCVPKTPPPPH